MTGRYRVVQWATGNVGRRSLAAIIGHPELDLVGLYVHSAAKSGQDAGDIAGTGPTGVVATSDIETLIELRPDCVCYMPQVLDHDLLERFLRAGINVVTTCGGLVTGTNFPARVIERIEAAAQQGGATFLGTGFDPGYANLLTGFLTGACRRVHSVKLFETLDCTTYPSAEAWAAIGFGKQIEERSSGPLTMPTDPSQRPPSPDLPAFFDALDLVADMLAVELHEKEALVERAAATQDLDLGWMHIPEGSLAGTRRTYRGHVRGRPVVELQVCWTMTHDHLDRDWKLPEGYRIEIEGEPRVEASITFGPSLVEGLSDETDVMGVLLVGTAMAAVNAIPLVCSARPGLTTPARLPVLGARHAVV